MRPALALLPLALLVAAGAPAPPATSSPAGNDDTASAVRDQSEDLIDLYQNFCLNRFPSDQAIAAGVAEAKLPLAGKQDAAALLKGSKGAAWTSQTKNGRFTLAVQPGRGCAVQTDFAGSDANRAVFEVAVKAYVSEHDLGALQSAPLQHDSDNTGSMTTEAFQLDRGAAAAKEQFIDMTRRTPDGAAQTRLVRVLVGK